MTLAVVKRGLLMALVVVALADAASAEPQRFTKIGDRLYFDSNVPFPDDTSDSIGGLDDNELYYLLKHSPDIRTVVLNSDGGSIATGRAMAETITLFNVDTEVGGRCLSACTEVFMGGRHRTLPKGSVLGFHRSYVEVPDIDKSSKSIVAEEFDIGVDAALANVKFMLEHGVDIRFALKALNYERGDMWLPSRAELTAAGVLTAP